MKKYAGERVFDLILVTFLMITLTPVFASIILAYWLTGNVSIIYRQPRLGIKENVFIMYKFRSLKSNEQYSVEDRKFSLGSFLRRTSLDELPQLWNVVLGDMSLVGPRPLPIAYKSLFTTVQRTRFEVKPGITGLTQIKGGTSLSWKEKFKFDVYYVENPSITRDILILLKTIGVLLIGKEDGLKEKPFTGN